MPTVTITHTSADGTLLTGSGKGDGAWEAIKAAQSRYRIRGWRYMPSIRAIGIARSRDSAAQLLVIDQSAEVLREAGFIVEIEIEVDGTPRRMQDAEASRAERMQDRAAALAGKAERLEGAADIRYAAAQVIGENLPMGQPVLVGHHCERGHRRDLKNMDNHLRKSIEYGELAKRAAMGAVSAADHMQTRTNPRRVYRRIGTKEAQPRKVERGLRGFTTGHLGGHGGPVCVFDHVAATARYAEELLLRKAHLEEDIRYWGEALAAAKEAGADVPPDTGAITKGWWVKSWAGWNEVIRVNKVTVTVLDSWGEGRPTFPRKITLDDIRGIRETSPFVPDPAADLDAELAALDTADQAKAGESTMRTAPAAAAEPDAVAAPSSGALSQAAMEALVGAYATERAVYLPTRPD